MAKIILKGIVKQVMPVETYDNGAGGGRRQSIILFVPGFVDDWGDKKGQDEEWQLDIFNDKIDQLAVNANLLEKRVDALVYVNCKKFQRRDTGEDMWMVSANLGGLKLHEPNGNTNQPANQNQPTNAGGGW